MRWLIKAGVQGGVSLLPRSEAANFLMQTRVTRNLPRNEAGFDQHVHEAAIHATAYSKHTGREASEAHAFEFGAGWDLIGPTTLYASGVEQQTVIDIRPNLRFELLASTLERLRASHTRLSGELGRALRPPPTPDPKSVSDLQSGLGITYLAPCDARGTGLSAGSFDLISSTFTLEHIPAVDIAQILREMARLLSPGGIVSCSIDMKDHYSYFDPTISPYNFLRFSPRRWRLLNPSLHHQNRLRRSEHLALFENAGLEVIEERTAWGSDEDIELINGLEIAPEFKRFDPADLAAKEITLVAKVRE